MIEFVDELPVAAPNSRVHRNGLKEFAGELKKQPGRWAIYPGTTTQLSSRAFASRVGRGKVASFGSGFEATSSLGVVYVRYVGKAQ